MDEIREFWQRHDETLPEVEAGHLQRRALSHDLYRGMPAWFNAYYAHFQQRAVRRLLKRCDPWRGGRVLDVGCGTGRWSAWLRSLGARPVGFDIGERALRVAGERLDASRFCVAALPELGFADATFDLAVSVTVLQHLPRTVQIAAIAELARVLKEDGYLLVCEITDVHDPAAHVFGNTVAQWREMFESCGLRVIEYVPCEYLPYVKLFQLVRDWLGRQRRAEIPKLEVSSVATMLARHPMLAGLLRIWIGLSYPLEYGASFLLPRRWARLGGFLCVKQAAASYTDGL